MNYFYSLAATGIFQTLQNEIVKTFITKDRWKIFVEGLGTTLLIALCALFIGIVIGMFIAVTKVYCHRTGKLKLLDMLCSLYLTVIRGTPVVLQLLIMYFVILTSIDNAIPAAILTFGINSGAYVAEIVRAGIMAVDNGQTEAGRSLGLGSVATMVYIVLPQAFKNILPALGNEFIALLKETSVSGYIAIVDLTKAGEIVKSRTYSAFFPLISVAVVYLVMVIGLSKIFKMVERRLGESDRR